MEEGNSMTSLRSYPTFIGVGAARSGSTALYHWLRKHPEVYLSPVKETNFFTRDLVGRNGPGDMEAIPDIDLCTAEYLIMYDKFKHAGIVWSEEVYEKLFWGGLQCPARGEFSPSYLYFASITAKRMKIALSDCKIVILLRNPIERAWSNYKALIAAGREHLAPEDAFQQGKKRVENGWEHFWDYLGLGMYVQQIKCFLEEFPRDQIGIWLYEDMIKNPKVILSQILQFIGVGSGDDLPSFARKNESKKNISRVKLWLYRHSRVRKVIKMLFPESVRRSISNSLDNVWGIEMKMLLRVREWLLEYYRDEILELNRLLPELGVVRWIDEEHAKLKKG